MKDILIIDDEQDVLDIIRTILNTKGYHIRDAVGGAEGIRKLEQAIPDLIICDLMMPNVSGRDVIKAVKENPKTKDIPFVTVSAMGGDQNKPADFWASGLGVDEYIFKPFDPMDLLGKVEALLRQHEFKQSKILVTPKPVRASQSEDSIMKLPPVSTTPSVIAKRYLLCWNTTNWRLEYHLMDPEMTKAYTLDVYKDARERAHKEALYNKVEIISEPRELIEGNNAKVTIEHRGVSRSGKNHLRKATIRLRKSEDGWRVQRVKDESL